MFLESAGDRRPNWIVVNWECLAAEFTFPEVLFSVFRKQCSKWRFFDQRTRFVIFGLKRLDLWFFLVWSQHIQKCLPSSDRCSRYPKLCNVSTNIIGGTYAYLVCIFCGFSCPRRAACRCPSCCRSSAFPRSGPCASLSRQYPSMVDGRASSPRPHLAVVPRKEETN